MTFTQEEKQINLTLSYIAYAGGNIKDQNCKVAKETLSLVRHWLDTQEPVKGNWQVVWGPGLARFPFCKLYDNMMYVVRNLRDRSKYNIVIRGTNLKSITDLLVEDVWIIPQISWNYGNPGDLVPKISPGTDIGFKYLIHMTACDSLPGAGKTLPRFLCDEAQKAGSSGLDLTVTGHSLGGTLASTLALYLKDYQWDAGVQVNLRCCAFAGATAGNKDFAAYSDKRLADSLLRIHNSRDVIPHLWNEQNLKELPNLYVSPDCSINIPKAMALAFKAFEILTTSAGYTQLSPAQQLDGTVICTMDSYIKQMFYQHIYAYPGLLGMGDMLVELVKKVFPI